MGAERAAAGGVLLALVVVFSGCAATDSASNQSTQIPTEGPVSTVPVADPSWRPNLTHGDWFTYRMYANYGFGALIDNRTADLVVTQAGPDGYEVHSGNREFGIVDAHFNDFYIGPLDADLNGQAGDKKPFTMFKWPLKEGDSWLTEFVPDIFGQVTDKGITFVVKKADRVYDPKGELPGFRVEGKSEKGFMVKYTYSPRVRWITEYERKDPAGAVQLSMKLENYGAGYKGQIHLVTKEDVYLGFKIMPPADPGAPTSPCMECVPVAPDLVQVNKDFTFLQEVVFAIKFGIPPVPAAPVIHVEIAYPDNTHAEYTHGDAAPFKFWNRYLEPYPKGQYAIEYVVAGLGGAFMGYFGFTDQVLEFTSASHTMHGGV